MKNELECIMKHLGFSVDQSLMLSQSPQSGMQGEQDCTGQGVPAPHCSRTNRSNRCPALPLCSSITEGSFPSFSQLEMILFQGHSPSGNGLTLCLGAEFSLQDTGVDPAPFPVCPAARKRAEPIRWSGCHGSFWLPRVSWTLSPCSQQDRPAQWHTDLHSSGSTGGKGRGAAEIECIGSGTLGTHR